MGFLDGMLRERVLNSQSRTGLLDGGTRGACRCSAAKIISTRRKQGDGAATARRGGSPPSDGPKGGISWDQGGSSVKRNEPARDPSDSGPRTAILGVPGGPSPG